MLLLIAYNCPNDDDIMCNSRCYNSNRFCYGQQQCSDVSLNCSKLFNLHTYIYTHCVHMYECVYVCVCVLCMCVCVCVCVVCVLRMYVRVCICVLYACACVHVYSSHIRSIVKVCS